MSDNVLVQLKDIDISFGGVHAVNHLSFDIYKGEILGLIGPNGSGKSTCVNIISGAYRQDSGHILFDGHDVNRLSIQARSFKGITRTFQSPRPFLNMTVFDSIYTIALLYNKDKKQAWEETENILSFIGFSEISDWLCSKLPIEKRKWLDMGRCLATKPKLLMLDECLAGLTPSEMEESIALVKEINQRGITILFIEHVMSAVTKLCSRVVVLADGELLSEGDPAEVMKQEKVIKAYLGEDYAYAED